MIKTMLKKLLASILLSVYLLTAVFVPIASAQQPGPWYNQTYEEWQTKVFDENTPQEIFGERYTYAQVQWVIYSLVAFLSTAGEQEVFSCLSENDGDLVPCIPQILDAAKKYKQGSANTNEWLATFTSRPISAVAYFKDIGKRLHIVPEAKAQGFGFGAANPVLALWRVVRNTTYLFLIIVIIAMAFMIMFRVKISPQAVITVQSALPKIIIALILITFSYAIAGFLIDLLYVVIGLLAGILTTGPNPISGYNWPEMFASLTDRSILLMISQYLLIFSIGLIPIVLSAGIIPAIFGSILGPLIFVLAMIVLLVTMVRILWLLLRTFVMILLQVILGPVLILFGTLGQGGFGVWLRNIMAQLAVYPAVGSMFVMAFVFLRGAFIDYETAVLTPVLDSIFPFSVRQTLGGPGWNPPLTVGSDQIELLWLGASLVIIAIIPSVANMIRSVIEGRPFAFGTAIGQALGPATFVGGLGIAAGVPTGATWLTTPPAPGERGRIREFITQRDWLARGIRNLGDTIARRSR